MVLAHTDNVNLTHLKAALMNESDLGWMVLQIAPFLFSVLHVMKLSETCTFLYVERSSEVTESEHIVFQDDKGFLMC